MNTDHAKKVHLCLRDKKRKKEKKKILSSCIFQLVIGLPDIL